MFFETRAGDASDAPGDDDGCDVDVVDVVGREGEIGFCLKWGSSPPPRSWHGRPCLFGLLVLHFAIDAA